MKSNNVFISIIVAVTFIFAADAGSVKGLSFATHISTGQLYIEIKTANSVQLGTNWTCNYCIIPYDQNDAARMAMIWSSFQKAIGNTNIKLHILKAATDTQQMLDGSWRVVATAYRLEED
jgi:hypothetical protein